MYCKNCGVAMNDNQAICIKCGVLVGDGNCYCANCGQEVAPNSDVCGSCNQPLGKRKFQLKNIIKRGNCKPLFGFTIASFLLAGLTSILLCLEPYYFYLYDGFISTVSYFQWVDGEWIYVTIVLLCLAPLCGLILSLLRQNLRYLKIIFSSLTFITILLISLFDYYYDGFGVMFYIAQLSLLAHVGLTARETVVANRAVSRQTQGDSSASKTVVASTPVFCKNCGEQMSPKQAMCVKCGTTLGKGNAYCSNCGNPLIEGADYCMQCGVAVQKGRTPLLTKFKK